MSIIYATADLHGNLPPVPDDAEALLLVGDICPAFRFGGQHDQSGVGQADWLDTTFRDWLGPIVARDCQVVAIWGNHDYVGEHPNLVPELPWTLLQDSEAILSLSDGPLRVYGTPWVPGLPYWAFFASDAALEARVAMIPPGLDVLMTHGPPYGAGDFIPTCPKQREKYGNFDGERVGDRRLREFLSSAKKGQAPAVTVCGHIHEDRGVHIAGDAGPVVYNVAAVDGQYALHERPFSRLYEF